MNTMDAKLAKFKELMGEAEGYFRQIGLTLEEALEIFCRCGGDEAAIRRETIAYLELTHERKGQNE